MCSRCPGRRCARVGSSVGTCVQVVLLLGLGSAGAPPSCIPASLKPRLRLPSIAPPRLLPSPTSHYHDDIRVQCHFASPKCPTMREPFSQHFNSGISPNNVSARAMDLALDFPAPPVKHSNLCTVSFNFTAWDALSILRWWRWQTPTRSFRH